MTAPDYSGLRDAAGAIRLAVSMLRLDDAAWLGGLPAPEQARIRSVLRALGSATAELVQLVGPDATAIAVETARALADRNSLRTDPQDQPAWPPAALPSPEGSAVVAPPACLSTALRRLEIIAAMEGPPRPQLRVDLRSAAQLPMQAAQLVSALQTAVVGLVRSRPARRQPWPVTVSADDDRGPGGESVVVIELRCIVADDSVARGPSGTTLGATLPPWLSECLRLTERFGGGLSRGRDGTDELVRVILPTVGTMDRPVSDVSHETAANDNVAAGPRRVA